MAWVHKDINQMIVGKGMLARAFSGRFDADPDVMVFASGVSNSQETRDEQFEREERELLAALSPFRGKKFVYLGSCGVAGDERSLSPYMRHKLRMERIVRSSPAGLVLRLPQVVGRTENPNTLTNYLYNQISTGRHFTVWANAERNLVDVDDVAAIGSWLVDQADVPEQMVAIASKKSMRSLDIVRLFEQITGFRANYDIVQKGEPLQIDIAEAERAAASLGLDLDNAYVERLIRKYYGSVA